MLKWEWHSYKVNYKQIIQNLRFLACSKNKKLIFVGSSQLKVSELQNAVQISSKSYLSSFID